MHAEMWIDRLQASEEGASRLREALAELWPYALGLLPASERNEFRARVLGRLPDLDPDAEPVERGGGSDDFAELWEEMTMVRRSVPGATW